MIRVAVVIPFFQRQSGILARSLRSIKEQHLAEDVAVEVLVVDDSSPIPPEAECAAANFGTQITLRIISRPNGGPGAARNTGLDRVDPATDFVAFLDSDDIWQPDHLQAAIGALGQDCDFYYCDHQPSGSVLSYFAKLREEQALYKLAEPLVPASRHGEPDDPLIYMETRSASLAIVRRYLAHTSTVVFRRAPMAKLRFFEKLRFAGEDYLFSLELAHAARKTCCSLSLNVVRGNGIDLYMGSVAWSHPDRPKLVLDNLKCFIRARSLFGDDEAVRNAINQRIKTYRTEFIWLTLRGLFLSRRVDLGIMKSAYRADIYLFLLAPALMFKATGAKLVGRRFIELS